ncbi:hypothetical protein FEAC_30510 [Ferrimicrobium acidiphilum DSM 19497]|uniref:Uncharacterized protein n=1 Tax=Ferrimicrobium acidiphilum DSM 19497 TaxID=1121877 RepID=A0A0D8FSJ8_9ACTN|nr:hypothetical protein FEAC_30510 [Ferrimicrobium acidiphilum DSM 19497]
MVVPDRDRITGEVAEELLSAAVLKVHDHFIDLLPVSVASTKPRIAEPFWIVLLVLKPEQLEGQVIMSL